MLKALKIGAVGLAVATVLAVSPTAFAHTAQPQLKQTGTCGANTWVLQVKHDNAMIEADFELHTGVAGQTWKLVFADNGVVFGRATKTTIADGSLQARRLATPQAGTNVITVKATNLTTLEVCTASASIV